MGQEGGGGGGGGGLVTKSKKSLSVPESSPYKLDCRKHGDNFTFIFHDFLNAQF